MRRFKCFGRFVASALRIHVFEVKDLEDGRCYTDDGKVFEPGYLSDDESLAAWEVILKESRLVSIKELPLSRREGAVAKCERIKAAVEKRNWVLE